MQRRKSSSGRASILQIQVQALRHNDERDILRAYMYTNISGQTTPLDIHTHETARDIHNLVIF